MKEKTKQKPQGGAKRVIVDYLIMTLGTVMMTVGIYFFKIPNGFSTGGVSGISTVLGNEKVTPLSPAVWISILNVVLLIIGFIFLGRGTGVRTVYCSLLYSGGTWLLEWLVPLDAPLTDQPFLELCYGMLLVAIGSAIIFYRGGSSGGTDIVALIIKKYANVNVGTALLCVDSLIAASSFFVFGLTAGLFSMLGLFAKAFVIDVVIDNLNTCKCFMIVTSSPEKISDYIIKTLKHSATIVEGHGAYTHDEKKVIYTVCRRMEAIRLQREARRIDPDAFITITTSSEIIGRGFRGV